MKKIFLSFLIMSLCTLTFAQKKTELFDLVKALAEAQGNDVGDWAVGVPSTYPVKWKEDRIIMSEDTSINFYRVGVTDITVNGVSVVPSTKPNNVMLRGPRMGFIAFNILVAYKNANISRPSIDSLFGKKSYTFKLLKSCAGNASAGFEYYEVSIPKKNKLFIKMSWKSSTPGAWVITLDCNDEWGSHSVKLLCPSK